MADQIEEAKTEGSRTCEGCKISAAEVIRHEQVYLCRRCLSAVKTIKYDDLEHPIIPPEVESPDTRRRKEAFAAGSAELEQNLPRIDQLCAEIIEKFDAAIALLCQWRDSHVRKLQAWKVTLMSEITQATDEVRRALELDQVQLKCKYSALLHHYVPGTLQLFSYQIDISGLESWVQSAVKLQYAGVISSDALAQEARDSQHTESLRRDACLFKDMANSKIEAKLFAEATELCKEAEAIFSRYFPNTIDAAANNLSWGYALTWIDRSAEAVAKFAAADAVLTHYYPRHITTARNISKWGVALCKMGDIVEAANKFASADLIYSNYFPDDIETARNLSNWGVALDNMKKSIEAIGRYAAADRLLSRLFPNHIETGRNLSYWGVALARVGNSGEAMSKFTAASTLLLLYFPRHIETARNFHKWGVALSMMGNSAEAVSKYASANDIYSRYFPDNIETGNNRSRWNAELDKMRNSGEIRDRFSH